ncbi:lantibiotic dehydratase [Catenulispora yoronensis]|uniref:lantibiotic dehydratase n=1 Tax=Catenulispora yoronensis TaxID=450799 RepID=UPI0031DDFA71
MAILRASTDPGGLDLPEDQALSGAQATAWLAGLWRRDDVRMALACASPALCHQIEALATRPSNDAKQVRRTVLATAAYLLRWQRRPTPFGRFAGVGVVRIGATAKARFGNDHTAWLRVDAGWLAPVIRRLHQSTELAPLLRVVANDTAEIRGERIVIPGAASDLDTQSLAPLEASIGATRPMRFVMDAAREPVTVAELADALREQFPGVANAKIHVLLRDLIDQQFLISALRAPMTEPDALAYLCDELAAIGAGALPQVADLFTGLLAIRDRLGSGTRPGQIAARMNEVNPSADTLLLTDVALDSEVQIPEPVAREAADAAAILLRLSPYALGFPAWRDYHARFRARYGTGALVPVPDLISDAGLGVPAGYMGSAAEQPARQVTARDEKLLALIQTAVIDGSSEIVLTPSIIDDLAAVSAADLAPPASLEIAFEIHSSSVEELGRGRFRLSVTGTPRPGSSMAGRHLRLLPDDDRASIAAVLAATEPDTLAAQLSFAPRKRRNENLVRTGVILPHVIPIGEDRSRYARPIDVSDLAVTADDTRFHLVQISTNQRIAPRALHALEAAIQIPPLARFLSDVVTARGTVYQGFAFGAAARQPYLPAIRYRRTILSPARWLLHVSDLPSKAATDQDWDDALTRWRHRWHVPDHVAIVEHDRRQPIDLGHRIHRMVLRSRLERSGTAELRHAAAAEDLAWLGRAHEVLLPLALHNPNAAAHRPAATSARPVTLDQTELPGASDVLYAQLHTHPAREAEVLTDHLPLLLADLGDLTAAWWFRRHRSLRHPQAEPFLALHIQLTTPTDYGAAATQVAAWAGLLRRKRLMSHLTLASYQPLRGRYGDGDAEPAARLVFAADSAAALAQIAVAARTGTSAQALTVAGAVDLAVAFAGPTALDWLIRSLAQDRGPLSPALRDQSLQLADPDRQRARFHQLAGADQITAAWRARAGALSSYADILSAQRDPETVLLPLLRAHHNRAMGVEPDAERLTFRLARLYALRALATKQKET